MLTAQRTYELLIEREHLACKAMQWLARRGCLVAGTYTTPFQAHIYLLRKPTVELMDSATYRITGRAGNRIAHVKAEVCDCEVYWRELIQ